MKRKGLLLLLSLLLLVIVCCCLAALFWDGYYLPYKPCRPITYPEGETITSEDFSHITSDDMEKVLNFFDQHLKAVYPSYADTDQWGREQTGAKNYLYYCYSSDINLLTGESGCIYVDSDGEKTKIRYMFFRSEGSNTPCPR